MASHRHRVVSGVELATIASELTATVRVRALDPDLAVGRRAAFCRRGDLDGSDGDDASAPTTSVSASAMRLPSSIVDGGGGELLVAPLALFLPFLRRDARGGAPGLGLVDDAEVHVMREATVDDGGSGGVWVPARVVASAVPPDARDAVNALASADGLGALKRGWTAGGAVPWNGDGGGGGGFDVGAVVAGFVVLRAATGPPSPSPSPGISRAFARESPLPRAGDAILSCGSPFGVLAPSHFANAVTTGSVSRTWRRRTPVGRHAADTSAPPPILMLDLRALPGTEGGVVLDAGGGVLGMLTPPLVARGGGGGGEDDAVPLALTIDCVKRAMLTMASSSSSSSSSTNEEDDAPPIAVASTSASPRTPLDDAASTSVVLLSTGNGNDDASNPSWASGIVLTAGDGARGHPALILTNAHVVHPSARAAGGDGRGPRVRSQRVLVPGAGGGWRDATPAFVSAGALDVAVLAATTTEGDETRLRAATFADDDDACRRGEPCAVIGHARVGPRAAAAGGSSVSASASASAAASASPGVVSAVVRRGVGGEPVMLTTSAAVHSGASGGAVVRAADGVVIGLVTSNARRGGKDGDGDDVFPRLNFSIPSRALRRLRLAAEASGGQDDWEVHEAAFEGCLDAYDDDEVRAVWNLRDPGGGGERVARSRL